MPLADYADPSYVLHRLGVLDAVPNALARTSGALRLVRESFDGTPPPVAPTPYEVLCQEGGTQVLRYVPKAPRSIHEPVVLVPSIINRPYVLDLMHGNSLVEHLLDKGYPVYMVDWGDPGDAEHGMDLADYVTGRLPRLIEAICADAGTDKGHLFGQCLGGTMTTALAAVDDSKIQSLINLTAPIGFDDDGILSAWSRAPFFDAVSFAEVFGDVPAWITQPTFVILKPMGHPSKVIRLLQNVGNPKFLPMFRALETWINDNVSIPKGFYIDLIGELYRKDGLVTGALRLDDKPVVLEEIDVPVLTIAASEDHIVPPDSAMVGHHRYSSEDKEGLVIDGGHIGVLVGGRGRRQLQKTVDAWIIARSTVLKGAPASKSAEA